jgi:hypothetical protein
MASLSDTGLTYPAIWPTSRASFITVTTHISQRQGTLLPYLLQETPQEYRDAQAAILQAAIAAGDAAPTYVPYPPLQLLQPPPPMDPYVPPGGNAAVVETAQRNYTFATAIHDAAMKRYTDQATDILFLRSCLMTLLPQVVRDGVAPATEFSTKPLHEILAAVDTMFATLTDQDVQAFETRLRRLFSFTDGISIEAHNSAFLTTVSYMRAAGCFPGYAAITRTYFNTFLTGPHASHLSPGIQIYDLQHPDAYTPSSREPNRAPRPSERHLDTAMPHMVILVRQKASTIKPNPYHHAHAATTDDTVPDDHALAASAAATSTPRTGPPRPPTSTASPAAATSQSRNRRRNNNNNNTTINNTTNNTNGRNGRPRYCFTCGTNTAHGSPDCPKWKAGTANLGHHPACTSHNYGLFPGAAIPK